MDRIRNSIKCAICHEILESPVILPCTDTICKKHVSNQNNDLIRCEKCGVEHQIPTNGFLPLPFLEEIIKSEIGQLDLGSVHKTAKKSCECVENALIELEILLKDPHFYIHERISELKNSVMLKGEELKLRIDEEMKKLIDRLEEYERQSKNYLSLNEFKEESKKLDSDLKTAQTNLVHWLENLNKVEFDEEKWKSIIEESDKKLKCLTEKSKKFKNKLLLNKFDENQKHVDIFTSIKIDPNFDRVFLVSRIIDESLSQELEELLKMKNLNGKKWSLLYQGSRDGFRSYKFHYRCKDKSNTLTIVKSTSGNIFGGFATAKWIFDLQLWQLDKNAFIFSLVNKENRSLLFEHTSNDNHSICSYITFGPIFGYGNDMAIGDNSNENTKSYSNSGSTYTHPDYPIGSEKAKTILAGSHYFQVQEIEVFQMQQ